LLASPQKQQEIEVLLRNIFKTAQFVSSQRSIFRGSIENKTLFLLNYIIISYTPRFILFKPFVRWAFSHQIADSDSSSVGERLPTIKGNRWRTLAGADP